MTPDPPVAPGTPPLMQRVTRTRLTPLLVLVLVLLLALAMALITASFVRLQQDNRFARETDAHAKDLVAQLNVYEGFLRSTQAQWSASGRVPDEATLDLTLKLLRESSGIPALQGLGFARWIPDGRLDALRPGLEAQAGQALDFRPVTPPGEPKAPIVVLAPDSPENRRALGFDMYSNPARRTAFALSRRTNDVQSTPPIPLVQRDAQGRPVQGLIIALPVWRGEARGEPLGFVYLAVRAEELVTAIARPETAAGLHIEVTVAGVPITNPQHRFTSFSDDRTLDLLGQPWQVHYSADAAFGRDVAANLPLLVLLSGMVIAGLAFRLSNGQMRARLRAESMNDTLNRARQSEMQARAEFEAIFQSMQDAAAFTDTKGRIRRTNRALTRLFGVQDRALLGQPVEQLHADRRLAHLGTFQALTTPYRRVDGTEFAGEAQRTEVLGPDGNVLGLLEVVRDVTERLEADRALRAADKRSRDVLDAVPHIVWVVTDDGHLTYTNLRHQTLLEGEDFERRLHPEDRHHYDEMWARARAVNGTAQCEVRLRVQESWRWYMIRVTPILDDHERTLDWVGSATDIHDRLVAERLAQRSEQRYRGVLEGMPQIVWLTDTRGVPTYFNRRWDEYVGAQNAGLPFVELIHPDDRDDFRQRWQRALGQVRPFDAEHRLLGADGVYRAFVTRSLPVLDTQGQLIEWVGTSTDVDDSVHAEASSRLLANVTAHLLAPSDEDARGRVQRYTQALELVTGRFAESAFLWSSPDGHVLAQSRPPPSLLRTEHERVISRLVRRVLDSGEPVYSDDPGMLERLNMGSAVILPLQGFQSRSAGVLGLSFRQPLTDRDHELVQELAQRFGAALEQDALRAAAAAAQADLRQLNQSLEERVQRRTVELQDAVKELEAFSYSVSHDLRTPLRHIVGFGELLRKETNTSLSPKADRYLNVITDASTKMSQLIDDLLQFSRMGRQELRFVPVNLNDLIRTSWQGLEPDRQGREIPLTMGDLPTVHGDPSLLAMVFTNLLSNAIKYTRRTPDARVDITSETQDGAVTVHVRDNGVGFDPEYASKLFGVFQRLHRAEDFEGIGIGLANVRRIVNRHGGQVRAEGQPGQGATFSVTLPLESPE
ncbi:PAS domain S-box protein [Deinococcus ficus]|nr:PAS domain S-box protein [Deinococcus ficus]